MAAPTNYPDPATEVTPEADPNSLKMMTPEDKPIYIKIEEPLCIIIRNIENRVLLLKNDSAVFEEMTDGEICDNAYQTHFIMQRYKDPDRTRLLATISIKTAEKTYTMSCKDKSVFFKEEAAPDTIVDEKDILFCIESLIGYTTKKHFKSFLYPQYYLAYERKNVMDLLILKYVEIDEDKDKLTVFSTHNCKKFGPKKRP
ncbi:interleukin-18-like [Antechinus flavipes]|uniref:interleukin-18-like n=1 Tax=Antechinus flavipes TaxID=38775 RepID=UPI002235FC1E|nr:interleukin-18-like [Antechinus flavipes]